MKLIVNKANSAVKTANKAPVHPYIVQYASRFLIGDHAHNYKPYSWNDILKPVRDANLLLLCGDIGYRQSIQTHEFIQYCSQNWENVVWIEGSIEKKINQNKSPPRKLPKNVKYVRESSLFCLKDSHQFIGPSSPQLPLYLYATPLQAYSDLKYLIKENRQAYNKNYLLVASYSPMPIRNDCYPNNIIDWIQGYTTSNYGQIVNMLYSFKNYNFHEAKYVEGYSTMKTIII